jgi:hypothetical protein
MNLKTQNLVMGGLALIAVLYLYKTFFLAPKMMTQPQVVVEAMDSQPVPSLTPVQTPSQTPGKTPGMISGVPTPTDMGVQASEALGHNEMSASVEQMNRTPSSCYPQKVLTANELLPRDDSAAISDFNQSYPIGEGVLRGINYLSSGYHIGVNTVGQSLRNANRQIRGEPPNPQVSVSPWLNTTIGPDLERRSLDVTSSCP